MTTRFRVATTLARKLEELGVSPALGYQDAHSFFRAFQGWEGSSPGAWRARHARPARSRSATS